MLAFHPPGVKRYERTMNANHIANLANAQAIKSFREYVKDGKIGPSFLHMGHVLSEYIKARGCFSFYENAEEFLEQQNGWKGSKFEIGGGYRRRPARPRWKAQY